MMIRIITAVLMFFLTVLFTACNTPVKKEEKTSDQPASTAQRGEPAQIIIQEPDYSTSHRPAGSKKADAKTETGEQEKSFKEQVPSIETKQAETIPPVEKTIPALQTQEPVPSDIKINADYIGAKKCKACHMKQYKAWQGTKMAKSFENLKPGVKAEEKTKAKLDPAIDYTTDPNCLKCHTTGYGKPSGFVSLEKTPDLIDVQCEACHGPGSEYNQIMKKNKEFKLDEVKAVGYVFPKEASAEKECLECHGGDSPFTDKLDPKYKWDFKDRLKKTHEHFPLKYKH